MPVFGGPQQAEIRIYDVKFVRGKLTKDIRSYAARCLELSTLPKTFQYLPYIQCIEGVAPRTCGA